MATPRGTGQSGYLGCGGFAFLVLVFAGLCGDPGTSANSGTSSYADSYPVSTVYEAPEPRETFYMHRALNVRDGPGKDYTRLRTLSRGERVELGAKDERGWAPVYEYGRRVGYVYRASNDVRSYPPAPPSTTRTRPERRSVRQHPAGASAICRDGTYSYSRNRRGTCSWHGGVAQWL